MNHFASTVPKVLKAELSKNWLVKQQFKVVVVIFVRKQFSGVNCCAFSFAHNLVKAIVIASSLYCFKASLESVDFNKFICIT